jgi:hypothetical protein
VVATADAVAFAAAAVALSSLLQMGAFIVGAGPSVEVAGLTWAGAEAAVRACVVDANSNRLGWGCPAVLGSVTRALLAAPVKSALL